MWQWTCDVTRVDSVIQIANYLLTNSHTVYRVILITALQSLLFRKKSKKIWDTVRHVFE